ncbi:MAG: hypothetical protein U0941_26085 [Planctomycetaceae bacterium]
MQQINPKLRGESLEKIFNPNLTMIVEILPRDRIVAQQEATTSNTIHHMNDYNFVGENVVRCKLPEQKLPSAHGITFFRTHHLLFRHESMIGVRIRKTSVWLINLGIASLHDGAETPTLGIQRVGAGF